MQSFVPYDGMTGVCWRKNENFILKIYMKFVLKFIQQTLNPTMCDWNKKIFERLA